MKNIFVLGASGSIGSQSLFLLNKMRKEYNLVGVSVGYNVSFLEEKIIPLFDLKCVYVIKEDDYLYLKEKYPSIVFFYGSNGIINCLEYCNKFFDVILNALIGFVGLIPTIRAIKQNKIILLANKESLVIGGEYINKLLNGRKLIYPIDSEHAAITKCLHNVSKEEIDYICITCSGGPFFNYSDEQFKIIKFEDALKHPTYNMGNKISIDSSTLMNKAFEIIEAYYLFNIDPEKIRVLIDRKSYVHSFIHLKDGTYKLSVGKPDMHIQIKDGLNLFSLNSNLKEFRDTEINTFNKYNFFKVDTKKFPLINYGYYVIRHKGISGLILNDADEICYKFFKRGVINYLDIKKIIDYCFEYFKDLLEIELTEENLLPLHDKICCSIEKIIINKEFN